MNTPKTSEEDIVEQFKNITKKNSALKKLIQDLSQIGQEIQLNDQDIVLKAGEKNSHIFFLLEGSLKILISGETVAELSQFGDLIGEMSIISNNPISADVISQGASKLLKVNINELKHHSLEYELLSYKIFCLSLTDKLEKTNIKAKNFEILNKSLEEQVLKRTNELSEKNAELILSFKKLENHFHENQLLLRKISNLDELHLSPAMNIVSNLKEFEDSAKLRSELEKIKMALVSLKELKLTQDKLQKQKVLVLDSNPKQRNMMRISLGGSGAYTVIAKSEEEAKLEMDKHSFNIAFISTEFLEIANELKKINKETKVVLLTEEESKSYVAKIKNNQNLSNIIAIKAEDRAFNIKSISTTISKMISGDIFGLEKYLNWGIEVQEFLVKSSRDRDIINNEVIKHLSELGMRSSLLSRCQIVIEEILMNAIYDAPVGNDGQPLFNHLSRIEEVQLKPEHYAKLRFATDGMFLAISVEDPFGAFQKNTIFNYLENNYYVQDSEYNSKLGKGGAGKGLYMITENCDMVIYNVSPKVKTEVIALFDLDISKDQRKTTSLHYFQV